MLHFLTGMIVGRQHECDSIVAYVKLHETIRLSIKHKRLLQVMWMLSWAFVAVWIVRLASSSRKPSQRHWMRPLSRSPTSPQQAKSPPRLLVEARRWRARLMQICGASCQIPKQSLLLGPPLIAWRFSPRITLSCRWPTGPSRCLRAKVRRSTYLAHDVCTSYNIYISPRKWRRRTRSSLII